MILDLNLSPCNTLSYLHNDATLLGTYSFLPNRIFARFADKMRFASIFFIWQSESWNISSAALWHNEISPIMWKSLISLHQLLRVQSIFVFHIDIQLSKSISLKLQYNTFKFDRGNIWNHVMQMVWWMYNQHGILSLSLMIKTCRVNSTLWSWIQNLDSTLAIKILVKLIWSVNFSIIEQYHTNNSFPLVPHICISDLRQYWLWKWLVACSAPSHYLNSSTFILQTNYYPATYLYRRSTSKGR